MTAEWRGGVASSVSHPLPLPFPRSVETRDEETMRDRTTARSSPYQTLDGSSSSQSLCRSVSRSQESAVGTASDDQVVTPPASDTSGGALVVGIDGHEGGAGQGGQNDQLDRLSALAAAQHRMGPDEAAAAGSRKRTADGEVKSSDGSVSPAKGHSRTVSAVSVASTVDGNIGEVGDDAHPVPFARASVRPSSRAADLPRPSVQLSAELRTRLSYAMVKVSRGWQSRSLDEVESLASQVTSPISSSASTAQRRHESSASPRPTAPPTAQVHFAAEHRPVTVAAAGPVKSRSKSKSNSPHAPPPALAPPASIQPATAMLASEARPNPRRHSHSRLTPTLLAHAFSPSPSTPGQAPRLDGSNPISRLDQDAAESLLFMSSPGNSAGLKHSFSPSLSPPRAGRQALPSAPRKALPSQRPAFPPPKKASLDRRPPLAPPLGSPMDLDGPARRPSASPDRGPSRRRPNGTGNHVRGALSLPSGLGLGDGTARKLLQDEDIERMLDRAGAEAGDSSDDDEIRLPPRRGVPGVVRA
ncbi:hypothetical protein DCS_02133 [Drechmeria coniospora]|uniref:Cyclin-dependent kinase n=1 Tax=Drechmeria coniospora TaxID=98403 RepID=A0A151GVA2_DRECN|nr:hypothetical protein DCS_02133 [Drechmeria coniospora]KYK60993.1 hypothetical protein DCS_02133 [Drechmeria coniospora]